MRHSLTHDASRLDRDVPHPAEDRGATIDDVDPLAPHDDPAYLDDEPPPDPHHYAYGYTEDHDDHFDFDAALTYRPTDPPPRTIDIPALRARRDAAHAHAAALQQAILIGAGGPATRAAAAHLADLYDRHHAQRPYLAAAAHAHADWLNAEANAEAHHHMLTLLHTLAREADSTGEADLAAGYRDRRHHLRAGRYSYRRHGTPICTEADGERVPRNVREIYRPRPEGCRSGSRRSQIAQPQLYRDRPLVVGPAP